MARTTKSVGVGASIMSWKARIGRPADSASTQLRIKAMSGDTTLARRRIATGAPWAMCWRSAASARAFWRPYSLTGEGAHGPRHAA